MKRLKLDLYARDHHISLGVQTQIMGILNVTPDSFSGDGRLHWQSKKHAALCVRYARQLIAQGADIIDVGGESSRPGAKKVSLQEEMDRVIPVIDLLARKSKVPISVDTYKEEVAKRALDVGASIINNIQGLKLTKSFLKMIKEYQAAIVIMHMRGNPSTMQKKAHYKALIDEVVGDLRNSVEKCLEIGIKKDRIILDPGIGFAKTTVHNLELINRLDALNTLHCPILLGASRKSFIGELLQKDVNHRLMGTAATVCAGIMRGAHIVRVHDVKSIKETVIITDAILHAHS